MRHHRRSPKQVGRLPRSRQTPVVAQDPFAFQWRTDSAGYEWQKGAAASGPRLVARDVPGSSMRTYSPLADYPGLFRDFSVLQGKDGIRQFADSYGTLLPARYPSTDRPSLHHLRHWEYEIEDMRVLVRLWDSIVDCNLKELVNIVEWESGGGVGYKIDAPRRKVDVWLWLPSFGSPLPDLFKPGDFLLPARYALQAEINARLTDPEIGLCVPRLTWTPDLNQRITITPPNLLAGMWLQFAQAVTGNYLLKRCPGCGNYFQAGPGGRRADAATCGNTCRQRKARNGGKN